MRQKTIVYTTSEKHWFADEFKEIKTIQEQSGGLIAESYDVKTIKLDSIPLEKGSDGKVRPSWAWFKNTLTNPAKALGYTQVVLHFSKKERKKFGITESLGGTYNRDKDSIIEFWMCADQGSMAKYYKGKTEFWRIFLHESAHGYERFLLGKDSELVHHYDYVLHNIHGIYKLFSWTAWTSIYNKLIGLTGVRDAIANKKLLPLVESRLTTFIEQCQQAGIPIRATAGFRTCEAQNNLYAQGRTKPGNIVTNAKCGDSLHNYGVAFDICFDSKTPYVGDWEKVGKIGESLGLEWGGRWTKFPDRPHFQLLLGYTLKDFKSGNVDYTKYI